MSKLNPSGGGGGGAAASGLPDAQLHPYASMLSGVSPLAGVGNVFANYLVGKNVMTELATAQGTNPYALLSAVDPDDQLDEIQERYEELKEAVDDFDPEGVVSDAITAANGYYTDIGVAESRIEALMLEHENRGMDSFARSVTRVAHGMQDIQATMTSQFGMALGLMEIERARSVADFEVRLRFQLEDSQNNFSNTAAALIANLTLAKITAQSGSLGQSMDVAKMYIGAKMQQDATTLEYATQGALWTLELFQYPQNFIAGINGAVVVPRAQTRGEFLLGAITTSIGFGLEAGTALKSPGAGVAAGSAVLVAQLLAMPK